MKGRGKLKEKVSAAEAKKRLKAWQSTQRSTIHTLSGLAHVIWPGHQMTSQGAALAAGGMVRKFDLAYPDSYKVSGRWYSGWTIK